MRWVFVAIALTLIIVVAVALGPSLVPFDVNNIYWDGYSTASSICLRPTYSIGGVGNASAVFITPETALPRPVINALITYVSGGGRLVIMGGVNTQANELLRELGIGSRFTDAVIEDPVMNAINPSFPLAFTINNSVLPMNASVIAMEEAVAIRVNDPGAVVLAETSPFSRVGNQSGPFPVVVAVPLGRGYVILVSSPTPFMNSLIGYADNANFLRDLCGNGTALYLEYALSMNNTQLLIREYLYMAYGVASKYPINYSLIIAPIILSSIVLLIRSKR
ncbi:MAG: DUF4350 domain-containing protein [Vulcanisaeta sp.]